MKSGHQWIPVPMNHSHNQYHQVSDINNCKYLRFFFIVDLHRRICNGFHFCTLGGEKQFLSHFLSICHVSLNNLLSGFAPVDASAARTLHPTLKTQNIKAQNEKGRPNEIARYVYFEVTSS